jgi:hypothetical protein
MDVLSNVYQAVPRLTLQQFCGLRFRGHKEEADIHRREKK